MDEPQGIALGIAQVVQRAQASVRTSTSTRSVAFEAEARRHRRQLGPAHPVDVSRSY